MALADQDMRAAIAVTRFGLGAKPGELGEARKDPQGFLKSQIRRSGADQPPGPTATSAQRMAEFRDYRRERREVRLEKASDARPPVTAGGAAMEAAPTMADTAQRGQDARDPVKAVGQMLRQDVGSDFSARAQLAAATDAAFRERWALFWANHFTVSATKAITGTVVGPFEEEAIRPNVFGRFDDLLNAAETHPAMLTYLDQIQSIGPDSQAAEFFKRGGPRGVGAGLQPAAAQQRTVGLNENLAREIMELHTVGVNGGYTQTDVTEFARAMTGLSIGGQRDAVFGVAVFRDQAHEPGVRTVMGVRYEQLGKEQANAILTDLAAKPQTARFVCTKIARHFVADDPPPALVARLEAAWTGSKGDLSKVAEALISAHEAWNPKAQKFKTPYEFIVSSYRAADAAPTGFDKLGPILTSLGQKPFSPASPKGWPEDAQSWAAPDAIVKRMQFAQAFSAAAVRDRDPKALAADALGERLSPETAKAIERAESRPEGFALLLMSPEFQRR
ncbi:DUF1800 domain-containing protein [Phenylobacterium sp.]|uniref:DUF1800 domain-containing protein n=1 Tax=Phenylobacterium sp. TaxID=1871053 RepID=UPI002E31B6C8|nr:DUF1800 family protein [Phenylobacterium sp.]HEX4709999.1 DUF1800 family protein [Phenylobacterium sp.]